MTEYWADIILSNQIEEWLLSQGAIVKPSDKLPAYSTTGQPIPDYDVYLGGRKIYFYSNRKEARIFFDDDNVTLISAFLIKFPNSLLYHNFNKLFNQRINND